ncbi:MAG: hypothetical protein DMF91_07405, partial [Acidobacteria bacterium]
MRSDLEPMLASLADAPLDDSQLVYEPKYDGIRAIAEVSNTSVHLWSRLGNEKTRQFPEIAAALATWARRLKQPVILDGEIVALDAKGDPVGFQALQGRIHLSGGPEAPARTGSRPRLARSATGAAKTAHDSRHSVAFIAFDILREGSRDFRDLPLLERRVILERVFSGAISPTLRLSEVVRGDGRALYQRALASGWEGLIAKHVDSRYKSGKRTPDWRKLKIVQEQEFVIGGWTEPRQTRAYFGALLLGVYEPSPGSRTSSLVYAGHTGTGFNEKELARLMKLLKPLETRDCPFRERPKTNEPPHWVRPELVAQIKFTEWTADGKLRHPVYLGLRDDKKPAEVYREQTSRLHATSERVQGSGFKVQGSGFKVQAAGQKVQGSPELVDELQTIEQSRRDGVLALPGGARLKVSNLHKVFWPTQKLTKGDLMRYYVQVAPFILPAVEDRPLVMKRFPNGITGAPFYQHRAPDDVPPGVRVERVQGEKTVPSRFIGGDLPTLLHMTQLAAISQDPWFSRVQSPADADYVALDLDPMPGV